MTSLHGQFFEASRDAASIEYMPLSTAASGDLNTDRNAIFISPIYITKVLGSLTILVSIAGIITAISKYVFGAEKYIYIFNLDEEANIPSWFSAQLLFISGLCLAIIALLKSNLHDRWKRHWWALSFIFVMLSLDEIASIHERANVLRDMFHLHGLLYFSWVVPAIVLMTIFFFSYLKFVFALPTKSRWLFVVSGIIYVGGALGLEMLDGAYASAYGTQNLFYALLTCTEEICEMGGMVLFIYALTDHLRSEFGTFRVGFNV